MTKTNIHDFNLSGHLFLDVPDTKLVKTINEALDLSSHFPEIIEAVENDLEWAGKKAKFDRLRERRWKQSQNPDLPWDSLPEEKEVGIAELSLETGRPRMIAEAVYLFLVLRGYFGSVSDQRAAERFTDSITVRNYLETRNIKLPAPRTILDNLSHVSQATRDLIILRQMKAVSNDALDNLDSITVDSTSVWGNSQWPTDSEMINKIVERAYRTGQKMHLFGLPNFREWKLPTWLKELDKLSFEIANCAGKSGSRRKRKKLYRKVRHIGIKAVARLESELSIVQDAYSPESCSPLLGDRLKQMFLNLQQDFKDVRRICEYNRKRLEEDVSVPSTEKVLSVADPDASMIVKGGREPVLGYKPQLVRTREGFVSAAIFETGNVSDAKSLVPLVEQHKRNTGVWPKTVAADDGYASASNRKQLLDGETAKVSFSGGTGKKIMPAEEWDDPDFLALRNSRSAVESVMFTLKYCFNFDHVRRRGIEAVKAELSEKIIAHNFWRMTLLRERKGKPPVVLDPAA